MNIGIAIKCIRKKLAITQGELAAQCYISQSTLSCIESGEKMPTQNTVSRICEVLSIPESIVYIIAIQDSDIPASKRPVYRVIHPMIEALALQIASFEPKPLTRKNNANDTIGSEIPTV